MSNNTTTYTLDNIEQFLVDYRKSKKIKPKEWMTRFPIIGSKISEYVYLENKKRDVLEQAYYKAKNNSLDKQNDFIAQMTPILDDFYKKETKNKRRKEDN